MIKITFDIKYTILTLAKSPANAFCLDFLTKLIASFEKIDKTKALIITGEGNIFSAGIDLFEIENISKQNFKKLIDTFEQLLLKIIHHPAPTYTILNGHAIAGGFILFSCTDICLSNKKHYRIGLNHNILNLSLPAVPSAIIKSKYKNIKILDTSIDISYLLKTTNYIKITSNPIHFINNHIEKFNSFDIEKKQFKIKEIMLYLDKYGDKITKDFYNEWWSEQLIIARKNYLKKLKKTKNLL